MNYTFHINDFEGPLDLLLHLIKEKKSDIYEINISEIIKEYLDYIHHMEIMNIDIASEYLVMASELIHIKSKTILNQTDEEDINDFEINSEEDLRNKLIMYQKYKDLTSDFKSLEEKRQEVFTKTPENYKELIEEDIVYNNELSMNDLLNAFLLFIKRKDYEQPVQTKITKKEYSIENRTKSIRDLLKKKKKISFDELFEEYNKEYIIVTFLSILDMSKNNEIKLTQEKNFDNIIIEAM